MSERPYEILAQPFTLWVAAVGSVFPPIEEDPGEEWTKVGSSGDLNYTEDGVTVTHSQGVEMWRALGSTGPRKALRAEEELRVSLAVADLTLEQYAIALNYATVSTVAPGAEAGYKQLPMSCGLALPHRALLIRGAGASPYGVGWNAQYEIPVAVQAGEPEVVYVKGEPAGLALEFAALEDPDADNVDERFGRFVGESADVLEVEP